MMTYEECREAEAMGYSVSVEEWCEACGVTMEELMRPIEEE